MLARRAFLAVLILGAMAGGGLTSHAAERARSRRALSGAVRPKVAARTPTAGSTGISTAPTSSSSMEVWDTDSRVSKGVEVACGDSPDSKLVEIVLIFDKAPTLEQKREIQERGGTITRVFRGLDGLAVRVAVGDVYDLIDHVLSDQGSGAATTRRVDWNAPTHGSLSMARAAAFHPDTPRPGAADPPTASGSGGRTSRRAAYARRGGSAAPPSPLAPAPPARPRRGC